MEFLRIRGCTTTTTSLSRQSANLLLPPFVLPSFENRPALLDPGSTLPLPLNLPRSFPPYPSRLLFPSFPERRNTPFVRARGHRTLMLAWYRGGLTRRTLLLRSARLVLVAPTGTPMPLSCRSSRPPRPSPSPSPVLSRLVFPRRSPSFVRGFPPPPPSSRSGFVTTTAAHDAPACTVHRSLSSGSLVLPPPPITASLIQTCPA